MVNFYIYYNTNTHTHTHTHTHIYIHIYLFIYLFINIKNSGKQYTGIDGYPKYIVPLAKPV